jgi:SAM-dependent methyltransferase
MLDDMWSGRPEKERRYAQFFSLLDLQPDASVLDVGCGSGGDALFVLRNNPVIRQVVAVEPSLKAIDRARGQMNGSPIPRLHLAAMDGRSLALPDCSFDASFCARVLVHARDARRILDEMIRVVRPGGRVLVIEPDRDGLLSPLPHDRVNRAFWAYRRSINPRIGIEAYGMMKARGLTDVKVLPGVQAQTTPPSLDVAIEIRRNLKRQCGEYWLLVDAGHVSATDLEAYADEIEGANRSGEFVRLDLEIATVGTKPA